MAFDPLSLLSGAGTSLVGGFFNALSAESANDANLQLMHDQQYWQERMWDKNNEYNTPKNQIQRLKDAGLNPNLMYGQGTVGNSSSPASGVSTPRMLPVNYGQGLVGATDQILKMKQAELLDAQKNKVESTTVPNELYIQGFSARVRKDEGYIQNFEQQRKVWQAQALQIEMRTNYEATDYTAKWNKWDAELEALKTRVGNDCARLAIQAVELENHTRLSYAQSHYYYKAATLAFEKAKGQAIMNFVNDETKQGQIVGILGDGLRKFAQGQISEKDLEHWFWVRFAPVIGQTVGNAAKFAVPLLK